MEIQVTPFASAEEAINPAMVIMVWVKTRP